ncbi:chondroadherin-like protein [Pollicipes pollicipes]|uniref:chondroadherin-like protein n=1 Tax=Pollicipes pollicipes TaxID=41117 RepID=UPI001884DBFD|nr:chondroadherin-like protein [Pollicipes pollicipes]
MDASRLVELRHGDGSISSSIFGYSVMPTCREVACPAGCRCTVSPTARSGQPLRQVVCRQRDLAALPDALDNGTQLRVLSLARNQIRTVYRDTFRGLGRLRELVLASNRISFMEEETLAECTALTALDLSGNLLTALPAAWFRPLVNTTTLNLSYNRLHHVAANVFGAMAALRWLDLTGNQILSLDAGALRGPTALAMLNISRNRLAVVPSAALSGAAGLDLVNLGGNPLTKIEAGAFIRLDVRELQLAALPELQLIDDGAFTDLPRLAVLWLCDNTALRYVAPGFVARAPALRRLLLHNTSLASLAGARPSGTLVLRHVHEADAGRYWCLAENSRGSDNTSVLVRVQEMDIHLFATGVSSRFVTLVWNGTARNNFPQYELMYRAVADDSAESGAAEGGDYLSRTVTPFSRSYTISALQPDTRYQFCLSYHDRHGRPVRISCTHVRTRDASFMSQGIRREWPAAAAAVAGVAVLVLAGLTLLAVAARRYRSRLYDDVDKDTASIPLENFYSPLISQPGSS